MKPNIVYQEFLGIATGDTIRWSLTGDECSYQVIRLAPHPAGTYQPYNWYNPLAVAATCQEPAVSLVLKQLSRQGGGEPSKSDKYINGIVRRGDRWHTTAYEKTDAGLVIVLRDEVFVGHDGAARPMQIPMMLEVLP